VVAVLIVGAAFGAYQVAQPSGDSVHSVRGFACGAGELCDRLMADQARRAAITNPGPIGFDGTADVMLAAISRAILCPPPALPNSCPDQPDRTTTDVDVVSARDALTAAGLPESIVRIAHPDGPAPAGALVFALRMGDGCVVGYLDLANRDSRHEVGGLLPNHQCLSS
jgi:hypothetical protein